MVWTGSSPNSLELGLADVPTWAWRFLEHIIHRDVTEVGGALLEAGTDSLFTPEPWMTIEVIGSIVHGPRGI